MLHLSYRVRIPLSLVLSAIFTALALGLVISYKTYRNIIQDQILETSRLTHALTPVLVEALKHDDIWLAYSLLRGPVNNDQNTYQGTSTSQMILIDQNQRIFASNYPQQFHTGNALFDELPKINSILIDKIADITSSEQVQAHWQNQLLLANKLYAENSYRGALIILLPKQSFFNRFFEIMRSSMWVFLLTVLSLALIGWYWGERMVAPLLHLRNCLGKVQTEKMEEIECKLYEGNDEFGELSKQFTQMLAGLKEKKLLEQQMVSQQRLAAVGHLTASVAHEINNPVGGMLVALDTWQKHPDKQRDINRLLALINRGLNQVKETVSALLVESRAELRQLTQDDLDDIHTLIQTHTLPVRASLKWHSDLQANINLPASAVRQILMNLVLNAIQSIHEDDYVIAHIETRRIKQQLGLWIIVINSGDPIPEKLQAHVFEPFQTERKGGTGLGLWITYQLVKQLNGTIQLNSANNKTCFKVWLPASQSIEATQSTPSDQITHQAVLRKSESA